MTQQNSIRRIDIPVICLARKIMSLNGNVNQIITRHEKKEETDKLPIMLITEYDDKNQLYRVSTRSLKVLSLKTGF